MIQVIIHFFYLGVYEQSYDDTKFYIILEKLWTACNTSSYN